MSDSFLLRFDERSKKNRKKIQDFARLQGGRFSFNQFLLDMLQEAADGVPPFPMKHTDLR